MQSTIKIDAGSFFESAYKKLTWTIQQDTDNGTMNSLQEDSITTEEDMREALKNHVYNISTAIGENNDLIDYEMTLSFPSDMQEHKKEEFTALFNEFNTRDEST